jgi:hypothetical protein
VQVAQRAGVIRGGVKLAIAALLVIVLLPFAGGLSSLLSALPNPFASERHERVAPPVLKSLQDLSEYHAATANLDSVVEVSNDASYLPSFIKGDDATFLASGSVDAIVDFSGLGADAIVTSEDGKSVTVTLPAPTYDEPHLNLESSKVLSHNRGILDRVGSAFADDPGNDQDLYTLGEQALREAAPQTELLDRATANTKTMLTAMLKDLGYKDVTVTFEQPPAPPQP